MDALLLEFIKENIVTLGLVMVVLKEIAKATPWAVDDKVVQILTGFLEKRKI